MSKPKTRREVGARMDREIERRRRRNLRRRLVRMLMRMDNVSPGVSSMLANYYRAKATGILAANGWMAEIIDDC